jgi:hypothetical protein
MKDYRECLLERHTDFLNMTFNLNRPRKHASKEEEAEALARELKEQMRMSAWANQSRFEPGSWNVASLGLNASDAGDEEGGEDGERGQAVAMGVQERLEGVWTQLEMPPALKMDMAIKYAARMFGGTPSSNLAHRSAQSEFAKLPLSFTFLLSRQQSARSSAGGQKEEASMATNMEKSIELWEEAAAAILEREALLGELEKFEETASDPLRFFAKSGSSHDRMEEARRRSKMEQDLARLAAKITKYVDMIQLHLGDTVSFKGRPYKAKMATDVKEMLFWLQEKRHTSRLERTY